MRPRSCSARSSARRRSQRRPREWGAVLLALSLYKSDDESSSARDKLLESLGADVQDSTASFVTRFLDSIGKLAWVGWKLDHVEVYALRQTVSDIPAAAGEVARLEYRGWISPGHTSKVPLVPPPAWEQFQLPVELMV